MTLGAPFADGEVRGEPLTEQHRDALREACAQDQDIWDIYPSSFIGAAFDDSFAACLDQPHQQAFALFEGDTLVGMSSYLAIDAANMTLEIGRTYLAPQVRGGSYNRRLKQLMLDRAFDEGFRRVEFRVDTRNGRSIAAVEKLGAMREGTLRQNRVTWTGYVRDTAIYAILAEDWRAR